MVSPLSNFEATYRLKCVVGILRHVTENRFLEPLIKAVGTIDRINPGDGFIRVASEIDQIEQTLRDLASQIEVFLAAPLRPTKIMPAPRDEYDVLGHLGVKKDDLNFLTEISEILGPIADSLCHCAHECRRGRASTVGISNAVAIAVAYTSRGIERFHARNGPVLGMFAAMCGTGYAIDRFGRIVNPEASGGAGVE